MKIVRQLVSLCVATFALAGAAMAQTNNPDLHLTLGNPSGATTSTSNYSNYLIKKNQYCLSYSRYDGIPNWVAWHLESQDMGTAPRSDSWTSDTTLPTGWYRVKDSDYVGTGFDRGHNCPSADRTRTTTDNKATFLFTNAMPQRPDNNQGPWERLETYCRTLVSQGNELYIYTCTSGSSGTIANGNVTIPAYVSKIIVVLPQGSNDLSRITTSTRVIAVDMPNVQGIRNVDWKSYRVSVDAIEGWTGYNFLSNVSTSVQSVIEARVDNL